MLRTLALDKSDEYTDIGSDKADERAASFGLETLEQRIVLSGDVALTDYSRVRFLTHFPTSDQTRLPAEFKHINKRRKRN